MSRLRKLLSILILALCCFGGGLLSSACAQETLCILDFNRLGDDKSMDWLERGLSDQMITYMNRVSAYNIIDRQHLKEILQEHGLALTGFIDNETAIKQAKLAKAQLLLLGNFAVQQGKLTIQIRLMRLSDQQMLSMATWEGEPLKVLSAPQSLSKELLAGIGKPFDPSLLEGIEKQIPRTIDVAESFYQGMEAFDNGKYPESLAYYLDSAKEAGVFIRVYREAINLYYLLEQHEHAVVFASTIAERLKEPDLQHAMEFYFVAADKSINSLCNNKLGIESLEKIISLAQEYEEKTHEAEAIKNFIRNKAIELINAGHYRNYWDMLNDQHIKYKIWANYPYLEIMRRQEEGDYCWVQKGKEWVKELIPEPSVFMWKTRAQLDCARVSAKDGNIHRALELYRDIRADHTFLTDIPWLSISSSFWIGGLHTEARFMLLYHYKNTGQLIRDQSLVDKCNEARKDSIFKRDFGNLDPDPRARVWSRQEGGGHEYFDFIAPPGYQVDAVDLEASIAGTAAFTLSVPDPKGWPPQYDLTKRLDTFKFSKGAHAKKINFPQGTEFFSIESLWGYFWSDTPLDYLRGKMLRPHDGRDIVWWQATFSVSPKKVIAEPLQHDYEQADKTTIEHYAVRYGWDNGSVMREEQLPAYSGTPAIDVYAFDWIVYSLEGDIHIVKKDDLSMSIPLPITINTNENEYEPGLVRTHEGSYALLWRRGVEDNPIGYFFTTTKDFIHWDTPQKMVFEEATGDIGYHYKSDPLVRTENIASIPNGYIMLLAQSFVRYSNDLKNWSIPQQLFKQDGWRNRILKSRDGRIWVIYDHFLRDEAKTPLHFPYAICISSSLDGKSWTAVKQLAIGQEPSDFWAFAINDSQIGIAVQHNNMFLKWFISSGPQNFREVSSPVRLDLTWGRVIEFFSRPGKILCARFVVDQTEEQNVVLIMESENLNQRFFK